MNVLKVLDRPIAFQRHFVTLTGSVNAALMLSQAVYWSQRTTLPDGWFYKTQPEWEDETGLTRREQDGARKVLLELGLIAEQKRGVPAKIFYQVQADRLEFLCTETPSGIGTKPPNCMHQNANLRAPNRQRNTETTSEITAESTTLSKRVLEVPSYIDKDAWEGFVEMRKKMRWTLTERSLALILKTLDGIHARGGNPNAALDQSTERCYRGVFEVKQQGVFSNGSVPTGKADRNMEILQRSLNRGKRESGAHEDGLFSASGDGRNDAGKLHAGAEGS